MVCLGLTVSYSRWKTVSTINGKEIVYALQQKVRVYNANGSDKPCKIVPQNDHRTVRVTKLTGSVEEFIR